jgi:hypothetical protein
MLQDSHRLEFLREHSLGGKDMAAITKQALEVIEYIKRYLTLVCAMPVGAVLSRKVLEANIFFPS